MLENFEKYFSFSHSQRGWVGGEFEKFLIVSIYSIKKVPAHTPKNPRMGIVIRIQCFLVKSKFQVPNIRTRPGNVLVQFLHAIYSAESFGSNRSCG